ncbi:hypothetical protein KSF73_08090 [Burkholderiaceae bacterium DAT-1]|nr:hypothetical protein [Burkholderiaceae bacterium DAT-1]
MIRPYFFLLLSIFTSSVGAEPASLSDLTKDHPKDVTLLVERIAMCTHFAGEEPYDAARRKEIATAMKQYRCMQLDQDEATLRKRYKDNPEILNVLKRAHGGQS